MLDVGVMSRPGRWEPVTAMRVIRIIGAIVIVLVALTALAGGVYRWDVAGSERPSDEALIKTFAAHRTELEQARCEVPSSEPTRRRLSVIGVKFASCDYDNTLRLGFDGDGPGVGERADPHSWRA
jgi:hypothetical protein